MRYYAKHANSKECSEDSEEEIFSEADAFQNGGQRMIDDKRDDEGSGQSNGNSDGNGADELADDTGGHEEGQESPYSGQGRGSEDDLEVIEHQKHCFFRSEFSTFHILFSGWHHDDGVIDQEPKGYQ